MARANPETDMLHSPKPLLNLWPPILYIYVTTLHNIPNHKHTIYKYGNHEGVGGEGGTPYLKTLQY